MKNAISMYFQLEMRDHCQAASLIRKSLEKIEQLRESGINIRYLELRAGESSKKSGSKKVWLKIDSEENTYTASDHSLHWETSFRNTTENIERRMLKEKADYTKEASLMEMSLPQMDYAHLWHEKIIH